MWIFLAKFLSPLHKQKLIHSVRFSEADKTQMSVCLRNFFDSLPLLVPGLDEKFGWIEQWHTGGVNENSLLIWPACAINWQLDREWTVCGGRRIIKFLDTIHSGRSLTGWASWVLLSLGFFGSSIGQGMLVSYKRAGRVTQLAFLYFFVIFRWCNQLLEMLSKSFTSYYSFPWWVTWWGVTFATSLPIALSLLLVLM